ncbi:hypothetical protein [Bradyrhizobium sp. CW1]|uniref:hypothetical protein n=1 Tax=Bradyrhizobium sp. CW1 TaxID=2782686 RepID=UPI00200033E2|nr:hypothetical protein [Bradyrhizobium sp. CW1]UPJ26487.1 hypothetical protein IVB54_33155 [Bradyrhizobium sp. CW1]
MFEIDGEHVAALNDEDLRALVGRLCEAELRQRELSTVAVTWSGNQTAKDGGLDVRVALPASAAIDGFIPKPDTGFQVKKQDMPRGEILAEMKPAPKGEIRPVITELAQASGAYIIVSAAGSTADPALKSRRDAMAEALKGMPDADKLTLDFYDRGRMATWVRSHPGLIPWVRSKIGKSIPGWRAYGSWSSRPEGADATYLVDAAARIRTRDKDEGDGISATDGINKIRDALRTPGHVARLVGLSGVGKTRLVEALFEPAVGINALDPSLAVYTDVADGPDPQPGLLASDLIAAKTRAILVIDNCPPSIHRQLAEIVRSSKTTLSVITVEYDIREDQPEGTDVFVLDTSSPELIEKLIANPFPDLSQIDRKTIADSSGGNARVALALAGTVGKNETVIGLSDGLLFSRLFQQRNDPDAGLLSMAQACSLVYSFEGEKLDGDDAELPVLGGLVGRTAEDVFGAVTELKQRHLLQTRGPWRAVLPHAIANRLATTALERIPRQKLLAAFVENAPPRLLQSFSRRLGYLDSSQEARDIVQGWLAPGGLLADVANLNDLGRAMFSNVAPVMPSAVLSALESALENADDTTLGKCKPFTRLLRSLAYDAQHFSRAVALLVQFARLPGDGRSNDEPRKIVESLFYVVLSGTHAPITTRLSVIDGLMRSSDDGMQKLGADALEAVFKTNHFMSVYNFEFGVRSRDYGYHPPTSKDVADWFAAALTFAEPLALLDSSVGEGVRNAIAHEFRGLWTNVNRADDLERIAHAVAAKGFWREGWIAARQACIYGNGLAAESLARLKVLEEFLRPKNLMNKVRGVVLGAKGGRSIDLDDLDDVENDDYVGAFARAAATVETLGQDVAADDATFKALLPDLIRGGNKEVGFGRGLALAAEHPREMWCAMVNQVAVTENPSVGLLGGFVDELRTRDRDLADALLDEAVENPTLAKWFPVLQAFDTVDQNGAARLQRALTLGQAPINAYYNLASGRACDGLSGPDFKSLVLAINARPGGSPVAIEILSMRIHADGSDKKASVPEVAEVGRALLAAYSFKRAQGRNQREDYELGVIVSASLKGDEGKPIVRQLCRGLLSAVAGYNVSAFEYDDLMTSLLKVHPCEVLDELIRGDKKAKNRSVGLMSDFARHNKSPMDAVPDATLIAWCDKDPRTRYPLATAIATLFNQKNDENPDGWREITRLLLLKAPDQEAVFKEIASRLFPTGGVGSLSSQYDARLKLLDQLDLSDMPVLAAPLLRATQSLRNEVDAWRIRETERDRARSGRFE